MRRKVPVVNIYNREDGKTVLRYLAERPVISGSEPGGCKNGRFVSVDVPGAGKGGSTMRLYVLELTSAEDEKCRYFDHCGTDTFGSAVLSAGNLYPGL